MFVRRNIEVLVGLFMLAGIIALVILALKVSGMANYINSGGYVVSASFNNIGDLKARAPVTIAGVRVGHIESIVLNPKTFQATTKLLISAKYKDIPIDSSASILTEGLLGSNYVSLTPGYSNTMLEGGDRITTTHSALILENLIGQLMFNVTNNSKGDKK